MAAQLNQQLWNAAYNGSAEACILVLDRGASQDPIANGTTPLFIAAQRNHVHVCELLLERGATHTTAPNGATPLHTAAQMGNARVCTLLLDRGATHDPDSTGSTPLHLAAENGYREVCSVLLDRGATHERDKAGRTPLCIAAEKGLEQVITVLLSKGAGHHKDFSGRTPLFIAAEEGQVGACTVLLNNGAAHEKDDQGRTPLYVAAEMGFKQVCEVLIDKGAEFEPAPNGWTPLHVAAAYGHAELCGVLLSKRAQHQRDRSGRTPLFLAVENRLLAVCEVLIFGGAAHTKDVQGRTPLYRAAELGHKEICAFLLVKEAGHDRANNSWTPLHVAARSGHAAVCQVLLDHQASHSRDIEGNTPLLLAAAANQEAVCSLLLSRGATHEPNNQARTPLHVAAAKNHDEICSLLLHNNASHNIDVEGSTPALIAAGQGHARTCNMLLLSLINDNVDHRRFAKRIGFNTTHAYQEFVSGAFSNCGDLNLQKICAALHASHPQLITLLGKAALTSETLKVIGYYLATYSRHSKFELRGKNIDHAGALALSEAIKGNTTIEFFMIENNEMGETATRDIFESLLFFTKVAVFSISAANIRQRNSMAAFATSLGFAVVQHAKEVHFTRPPLLHSPFFQQMNVRRFVQHVVHGGADIGTFDPSRFKKCEDISFAYACCPWLRHVNNCISNCLARMPCVCRSSESYQDLDVVYIPGSGNAVFKPDNSTSAYVSPTALRGTISYPVTVSSALKLLLSVGFMYGDMISDCLVVSSLVSHHPWWASIQVAIIVLSMWFSAFVLFRGGRRRAALWQVIGLGPLYEEFVQLFWQKEDGVVLNLLDPIVGQAVFSRLKMWEAFLESAPQLVVQLYISLVLDSMTPTFIVSIGWSFTMLIMAIVHLDFSELSKRATTSSQPISMLWLVPLGLLRCFELASQVLAIVLLAITCTPKWMFFVWVIIPVGARMVFWRTRNILAVLLSMLVLPSLSKRLVPVSVFSPPAYEISHILYADTVLSLVLAGTVASDFTRPSVEWVLASAVCVLTIIRSVGILLTGWIIERRLVTANRSACCRLLPC